MQDSASSQSTATDQASGGEKPCVTCAGCGRVDSASGKPWKLVVARNLAAVREGTLTPKPCPDCKGVGFIRAKPVEDGQAVAAPDMHRIRPARALEQPAITVIPDAPVKASPAPLETAPAISTLEKGQEVTASNVAMAPAVPESPATSEKK